MFLGTPHRGSDIAASLGPLIEVINFGLKYSGGSFIAGSMRGDLVKTLSRNSAALDEINESFIPRAKNMHIISCHETRSPQNYNELLSLVTIAWGAVLTGRQIVSRQSALLQIPDEEDIALSADHMNLCRFSLLQDSGYKTVSAALLRVAHKIFKMQPDVYSTSAQSIYCKLLNLDEPPFGAKDQP